jgi:hypothetical protein
MKNSERDHGQLSDLRNSEVSRRSWAGVQGRDASIGPASDLVRSQNLTGLTAYVRA